MRKGSITIYLSFVFSILLSLVVTLISQAGNLALKLQAECAMDSAMYSVFSEYQRELFDRYDLFFIDSSYYAKSGSIDETRNHYYHYLEENLAREKGMFQSKSFEISDAKAEQIKVLSYALATDENGSVLKRQAIDYMKSKYGSDYIKLLKNQLELVNQYQLLTRDIKAEQRANQAAIKAVKLPKRKTKNGWEDLQLHNPADVINDLQGVRILDLVLGTSLFLSNSAINQNEYASKRDLKTGYRIPSRSSNTPLEELIFNEYIVEKCSNYTDERDGGKLSYELEYVLVGKESDRDNLEHVCERLIFMRQVSNTIYLFSNQDKVKEAKALAAVVCVLLVSPELIDLVTYSLLFAWEFAESIHDVKVLLNKGSVPLIKTDDSWHYSLENIFQVLSDEVTDEIVAGQDDSQKENGELCYKDYLRIFLALESTSKKANWMMDIIEMNIQNSTSNSAFHLDNCLDYLEVEAIIIGKYAEYCCIKRHYQYL